MGTSNSIAYDKAYKFAIRIVKAYKYLTSEKKEYVLSKQLLRSGTSIGANLAEANGAISPQEFSSKVPIAYKETLETKYWLSLLKDTDYITEKMFQISRQLVSKAVKQFLNHCFTVLLLHFLTIQISK
ncbi:MAG: four helix bundle protein [Xenococcus sp. (in: cyanobacteria)]